MSLIPKQVEELAQLLSRRDKELREEIQKALARSGDQHYIDLASQVTDEGDQAVADLLVDIDTTMTDRDINELRDIDAANVRMRSGNYGICISCNGDIEYKRLLAFPTAKRCYACQQQHEKTYATQATPSL